MKLPSLENGGDCEKQVLMERSGVLFGSYIMFQASIRYLNGDLKVHSWYKSLKFRRHEAGLVINLGVIGIQIESKVIRINCLTKKVCLIIGKKEDVGLCPGAIQCY